MDSEEMKDDFAKSLAVCFKIQSIDLSGCRNLTDMFFNALLNGEKKEGTSMTKPGLSDLQTLKINFLQKILDNSVLKMVKNCSSLEHLELAGCETLTEFAIETIVKDFRNITFIDVNHIPVMTQAFFETLKEHRPDLMMRRF